MMGTTNEAYQSLQDVLDRAFNQAATGKGAVRHGQNLPFEQQPMLRISHTLGTNAGLLYQAAKKAQESQRMDKDAAVAELLGAINYLAGAIIFLETAQAEEKRDGSIPPVAQKWSCPACECIGAPCHRGACYRGEYE